MFSNFNKTFFLFLFLISINVLSANFNTPPSSKRLKNVYTYNFSTKDRLVLKLYTDYTYEFINFKFRKERKFCFRETGKYVIENQILKLSTKTANKNFEHPFVFDIIENNEIKKHPSFFTNKSFKDIVFKNDSSLIYFSNSYKDSIFGTIYNDYFLPIKFNHDRIQNEIAKITPSIAKVDEPSRYDYVNNKLICDKEFTAKQLNNEYYKKLKVVLLVGRIGGGFDEEIVDDRKNIAKYLKSLGVQVVEIYPPNKWRDVVNASKGANIFIYAGHGGSEGDNGTGGICLNDGIHSSDLIRRDLKLNKNALIIFNYVCRGAGSSSLDPPDIGISEATKRVIDYSRPFFDIGARTYFADNYVDTSLNVIKSFFAGKTLEQIYIEETKNWDTIELRIPMSNDKEKEIAISSNVSYDKKRKHYSIAYVGSPCFTIWEVFNK